jgi:signal transduction histidine kinase
VSQQPQPSSGTDRDEGTQILVVENDPLVLNMLAVLLGSRWTVRIAEGGDAALALARRSTPDLIISDVHMPDVDGITLVRRLRDDPSTQNVPVILVSSQSGERETIAGLEAGADDFLVKPFSARELQVRIQTRLEITAMRRRNARQEAALESLRRHTAWTERLLDSLPVPLLLLEPGQARVLFANAASVALYGHPLPRGLAFDEVASFRAPDAEAGATISGPELAPASADRKIHGRRLLWMTAGGPRWLLADSELIPQYDHYSAVAVLTLRDITELVRHEDDLRLTVRLRDEFLSVASHELRTPISTLTLQTETLLRDGETKPVDERLQKKLLTIRNQISRLSQLVDVLLDVSRLIEGRLNLRTEEVDLASIAAEAIDMLRESAERAGCPIHLNSQQAVPGWWDRLRVGQVVTNLLSNAIKFGPGQPVDVDVETTGDRARLRVRDRGIGVPNEARERIFARFERASAHQGIPGLGLGLWITKQIVDAYGGSIGVDSQVGKGSTFTVELPRMP